MGFIEKLSKLSLMTGAEAWANIVDPSGKSRPRRTSKAMEAVEPSGEIVTKVIEPPSFRVFEADIRAVITWRKAIRNEKQRIEIRLPMSYLPHVKMEAEESRVVIYSKNPIGPGCRIDMIGTSLSEIHLGGEASMVVHDIRSDRVIATVRGSSSLWLEGESMEAHYECIDAASIDAASMENSIAIVDASNDSIVITRSSDAVQATLSGRSTIVTIGVPTVMDACRE